MSHGREIGHYSGSLNSRIMTAVQRILKMGQGVLPDFDFQLQIGSKLLRNFGARQVDQAENILETGFLMGDDEIRMAIADFRGPPAGSFQSGLFDQGSGAETSRVLEDAAG